MDAKEFINSNAGTIGCFPMDSELVLKYYALEALEMQRKEDVQIFKTYLLRMVPKIMAGKPVDLEGELNKMLGLK